MINEIPEGLKSILSEMCNRVGTKLEDVDFTENFWFAQHSWTIHEEDDFKEWMFKFISENYEMFKNDFANPKRSVRKLKKQIEQFVWNYGWKYKEN